MRHPRRRHAQTETRGCIDHLRNLAAFRCRLQLWHEMSRHVAQTENIYAENPFDVERRRLVQFPHHIDAGDVAQHVDPAKLPLRLRGQPFDVCFQTDIARHSDRLRALLRQLAGNLPGRLRLQVGNDDPHVSGGTLARKCKREAAPMPLAPPVMTTTLLLKSLSVLSVTLSQVSHCDRD